MHMNRVSLIFLALIFNVKFSLASEVPDPNNYKLWNGVLTPKNCATALSLQTVIAAQTVSIYDEQRVIEKLEQSLEKMNGGNADINGRLVSLYEKMLEKGGNRYVISPPALEAFEMLMESSPNFKEVIEDIKKNAAIYTEAGGAMQMQPILLLGDPGLGKTHFASALSRVLGTQYSFLSLATQSAGWILSGAASTWKGAREGRIAENLIRGDFANPIFVIDEIDKAAKDSTYDPLGAFYSLLESDTAQNFEDEFLEVSIDTRHVIWVATANYAEAIPEPILNRMRVYYIQPPDAAGLRKIAQQIYKGLLERISKMNFEEKLRDDVLDKLTETTPRKMKDIIWDAIGTATLNKRRHLVTSDLKIERFTGKKSPIGFVQ